MNNLAARQEVATVRRPDSDELRQRDVRAQHDETWLETWQAAEPKLRRLGQALGIDGHRMDDILQDAYLAALAAPERAWDDEARRRWLFRVAINRCRLEHRRRRTWQTVWEKLRGAWSEYRRGRHTDAVEEAEQRRAVRAALDQLNDELRNPLLLRYYCQLDSTETGQILELPASTVRSQLRTGRQRLATILRAAGFQPCDKEG